MLEKVQEIINQYIEGEDIVVTSDMTLFVDLGLNSYEIVQVICEIEEKFDTRTSEKSIGDFRTIQDVLEYIV